MATRGANSAGGDGPGSFQESSLLVTSEVQETTSLLKEHPSRAKSANVQRDLYQSLNISVERTPAVRDEEHHHLIGPPQASEFEEDEVVIIQNDQSLTEETTNDLQCLMHILKGNIGTGVLAMPVAVSHAGLWTGLVGILFVGLVATHCMHLLVKSSKLLSKRTVGMDKLSYADVMELVLKSGPPKLRKLSYCARHFVNALLLFTQFGFCCVYIVFIATNIKELVDASHVHGPGLRIYELAAAGLLALYCMIKDLRTLAPFSVFANILTLVGMVLIFMNILQGLPDVSERPAFSNFVDLPLFFGTAIFAFEGISLVLPLESSMRVRERFSSRAGVLNLSMVSVVCLYAAMGFYGYLKFGENVKGSITLNLPTSPWYYLIVKPMFAICIFVSYNIQFFVPIRIIVPWLADRYKLETEKQRNRLESLLRLFFVALTMGCAMAIPHLDLLIALIGALASSSLAIILPPLIHTLALLVEPQRASSLVIVKNILIIILGVIGFITGTYTAIREIVHSF